MGKRKMIILAVAIFAIIGLGTFVFAGSPTEEYLVRFDSNGGTEVQNQKVESGDKASRPKDPTRENYEFAGWYLSLTDEVEYDFAKKVFGDITLYAKWNQKEVVEPTEPDNTEETPTEPVVTEPTTPGNTTRPNDNTNRPTTPTTPEEPEKPIVDQDQVNLDNALASITAKTLSNTGDSVDFTSTGCTITSSTNSNDYATIINGSVTKLYRGTSNATVTTNYNVTCGSKIGTKSVNHTILASTYTYRADKSGMLTILKLNGGHSDYTIKIGSQGLEYVPSVKGVQVGGNLYEDGKTYKMIFNNNKNVEYAITYKEV